MKLSITVAALTLSAAGAWGQGNLRLKACGKAPCAARRSSDVTTLPAHQHVILQFRAQPGPAVRAELAGRGIRILGYVPDSGLMVSASRPANLDGLEVTWAGPLAAADKLSPALAASAPAAYLVVFHPDVGIDDARALVVAYGFEIIENPDLIPGQLVITGSDVAGLAASDDVAYIMPASTDLVSGSPVMGCSGPLTQAGSVGEYVQVGNGWPQDSGGGVSLHYFFQSLTGKVDESQVRGEIERAFREWEKYANIQLAEGGSPDAARTVNILFASGAHGDAFPFDGPGGVLAHTFYPAPPNAEPIAGDMHFDADEAWKVGAYVDLFTVALHEAGHALGLAHSSQPGSVMYPYYHFATGLTSDDIAGIQALYGTVAPSQPPSQPPAQPPVTPPVTPPVNPPVTPPVTPPVNPPVNPPPPAPGVPDTTPPSLIISSPGATIVSTSSASLHIAGTAADNVGVTSVKWSTSNGDAGIASGTGTWSADVPLYIGNTVITVRAYDAAGNSGWRAITAIRQ